MSFGLHVHVDICLKLTSNKWNVTRAEGHFPRPWGRPPCLTCIRGWCSYYSDAVSTEHVGTENEQAADLGQVSQEGSSAQILLASPRQHCADDKLRRTLCRQHYKFHSDPAS